MKNTLVKISLFVCALFVGISSIAQEVVIADQAGNHNRANAKLYVMGMEAPVHAQKVDEKMKTHEGVLVINTSFEGKYTKIMYDKTKIDVQYLITNISLMGYAVSEYYEPAATNGGRSTQYNDDGTVKEIIIEEKEPKIIKE